MFITVIGFTAFLILSAAHEVINVLYVPFNEGLARCYTSSSAMVETARARRFYGVWVT